MGIRRMSRLLLCPFDYGLAWIDDIYRIYMTALDDGISNV